MTKVEYPKSHCTLSNNLPFSRIIITLTKSGNNTLFIVVNNSFLSFLKSSGTLLPTPSPFKLVITNCETASLIFFVNSSSKQFVFSNILLDTAQPENLSSILLGRFLIALPALPALIKISIPPFIV